MDSDADMMDMGEHKSNAPAPAAAVAASASSSPPPLLNGGVVAIKGRKSFTDQEIKNARSLPSSSSSAAAAASSSSGRDFIPMMHLLSAAMTDPRSELNASVNRLAKDRFEVVPNRDTLLCYTGMDTFHLHPPTYPNYIPRSMSESWKIKGMLHQRSLGVVDSTGMTIVLHPEVVRTIQEQQQKEQRANVVLAEDVWTQEEFKEENAHPAAAAASSSVPAAAAAPAAAAIRPQTQYTFTETPPIPAHSVFPISVNLTLRAREIADIGTRLRQDANANKYTDRVWPRVIQYYRALPYQDDDPAKHYTENVLSPAEGMDPYFDIGLFGRFRNGLSVLLIALSTHEEKAKLGKNKMPKLHVTDSGASSSAAAAASASAAPAAAAAPVAADDNESVHKLLCHYITMVSLQFWTMIHRRWLELDPKEVPQPKTYLPPYLFYFHHATDFTQSNRVKRSKKGKKAAAGSTTTGKRGKKHAASSAEEGEAHELDAVDVDTYHSLVMVALGDNNEGAFINFLSSVFKYVLRRMLQLAESTRPDDLEISFACKKLRMSDQFAEKLSVNLLTNHTQFFTCARLKAHPVEGLVPLINHQFRSGTAITQVLDEPSTKFFPRNKDDIKMTLPKAPNDTKVCGETRYVQPYFWSHAVLNPDTAIVQTECIFKPGGDITMPIHQACILRRLMFLVNSNDAALIKDLFSRLGDCVLELEGRPPIKLSSSEFYTRAVESKPREMDLDAMRNRPFTDPIILPPVIVPGAARFCEYLDEETGRTFVPEVSKDVGSLPALHESDITSMTKQQFIRLFHRGVGGHRVVKGLDSLLELGVLIREPLLCVKFHRTKKATCVETIGGLTQNLTKLDPDDEGSDLAFHNGMYRLSYDERRALKNLTVTNGKRAPMEQDMYFLWVVFTRVCLTEEQAVASYAFHALLPAVKLEAGEPAPPPPDDRRLARVLRQLQEARLRQQQVDIATMLRTWGATTPAKKTGNKRAREMGDQANPYWPAQRAFLAALDSDWNHCEKPTVQPEQLSKLACDLIDVDLPQMEFVMIDKKDRVQPNRDIRNTEEGLPSEQNADSLRSFFHRMLTEAYASYSWNAANQDSFAFMTQKKTRVDLAVPGLGSPKGYDALMVRCNAAQGSKLLMCFQYFFGLPLQERAVYLTDPYLNGTLAFFLWYYYTTILRPFIYNMSVLYPDSSLIKVKQQKGVPLRWVQSLTPSDSTPVISKTLFTFLSNLSKNNIFGELATAVTQNAPITDKAEVFLHASQMAIRAQDDAGLDDNQNKRLIQIYDYASTLLTRKHNEEGVHMVGPTSSMYQASRKMGIQETAVKVVVKNLLYRRTIPDIVITTLFNDLCAVTEPHEDPTYFIALIFVYVLKDLKALNNQGAIVTLYRVLDNWKSVTRVSDLLFPSVAKMALSTEEFKRHKPAL